MVAPRQGRAAVEFIREAFGFAERHACRVIGIHRSTHRFKGRRGDDDEARALLREAAIKRPRFGYRRLTWQLRRDGLVINHKRVYRLYREEGLMVRRKKRKKLVSAARVGLEPATRPNERWTMDFVEDALADGRQLRTLTIVDEFSRECPRIEVDTSLPGLRVVRVLDELAAARGGNPGSLLVDNGPEFIGKALDLWAYQRGVALHFTRPGKPTDKPHVESFNGKFRDECLNMNYFVSVSDACRIIEEWRVDYNTNRPHSALNNLTPAEFLARVAAVQHLEPVEGSLVREEYDRAHTSPELTLRVAQ